MLEIPALKIAAFVALTLCPEDADRIVISGGDGPAVTLIKVDKGWMHSADGAIWKTVGTEVVTVLKSVTKVKDVGHFIDSSIARSDWAKRP